MHGISRKTPSREEQEASALKATELRDLQSQFLHLHHSKIYNKEALETSAKLLEVNPEHYTGWNYRKLAVQHFLNQQSETEVDFESIQSVLNEELKVVENALKNNFKSYGAWYHRKWVLSKGHSSTDKELRLLGKFQKLDSRNFHAWNYRRFITMLKNISDEEELQYTTDMICDNFSNYSAWHNRSVLLSHLFEKRGKGHSHKEHILEEEFEFVRNALFTDPDDQSGWFYHLWLLDQTVKLEPLLLSSWPPHGSSLYLSVDDYFKGGKLFPRMHFQSKDRMFPIILYFSEAVDGVSSSTITIEYEYYSNDDVIWRPLSAKRGCAQAWLTYLNFPDEVHSLKGIPVKVIVAQFPGIVSSNGISFSQISYVEFSLFVPSRDREHAEEQNILRILWKNDKFYPHVLETHDASLLNPLHQLKIAEEGKSKASNWSMKTISNEISHCRELLSSTNCKIGKLTLARLLLAQSKLISYCFPTDGIKVHYEIILGLYHDLMKLDPVHICYYEDEYSLVLLKQVTLSMESLLRYCHQYGDSTSPSKDSHFCLLLNDLSLSRIGSVERFLWIQMLDLSHNKIRSIEGLEALQLLSCLNLNNNKICSFAALDPLRMLKSLKVLDISYNEIGSHSVDTRRYLCSSPMTHAVKNDWDFKEFANIGLDLTDHWDAFFIFRDLNLTQLDILGNAVVSDQLKLLLFKLMPSLKWLDVMDNVDMVWISACYPVEFEQNLEGIWIWKYVGNARGRTVPILVSRTISYVELYEKVKEELNIDSRLHEMEMACLFPMTSKAPIAPIVIDCDKNVKWFMSVCREKVLCITLSEKAPGNRERIDVDTCLSRVGCDPEVENMNREGDLVQNDNVVIDGNECGMFLDWNDFSLIRDSPQRPTAQCLGATDDAGLLAIQPCSQTGADDNNADLNEPEPHTQNLADDNMTNEGHTQGVVSSFPSVHCGSSVRIPEDEDVQVKQLFPTKKVLIEKLQWLALKCQFEFKVKKSNRSIYIVVCVEENCKWRLRATKMKNSNIFEVRKYQGLHNCSMSVRRKDHRHASYMVIGNHIVPKYQDANRIYRPRDIINDVRREFGITISYTKAYMAKYYAAALIRGNPSESYAKLPSYCHMLELQNPGTRTFIHTTRDERFKYFFMALGPSIRGFLTSIRRVISVDGTFLTSNRKGALLLATCQDAITKYIRSLGE